MFRIAIAEDDPACAQQLRQYILDYGRESGHAFDLTFYTNGEDLVEHYRGQFDVLFLDVDMPFMDGMTAAEHIRRTDQEVVLIFVTNLAQHAIRGYAVDALDYVLKPVSYFSFSQRLGRALLHADRRHDGFLTVDVKGGVLKLPLGSIYYIERQGHGLHLCTRSGPYTSPSTLQQVERSLEGTCFFRCNKGCLVNLAMVDGVQDSCALVHGERLPISRARKSEFMSALTRYLGEAI